MPPRSAPPSPWLPGVLLGLVAGVLTGCESDRHHRDDRGGPHGQQPFARRMAQEGQHGPGGWRDESRAQGSGQHHPHEQSRPPESVLHRLEMGREAAREIGDLDAANVMQRAVQRVREGERQDRRGPQDAGDRRRREQEHLHGDLHRRLERLEQRVERLMRAVEDLMRQRNERKAV